MWDDGGVGTPGVSGGKGLMLTLDSAGQVGTDFDPLDIDAGGAGTLSADSYQWYVDREVRCLVGLPDALTDLGVDIVMAWRG